jgi:hypothetical protein
LPQIQYTAPNSNHANNNANNPIEQPLIDSLRHELEEARAALGKELKHANAEKICSKKRWVKRRQDSISYFRQGKSFRAHVDVQRFVQADDG